MARGSTPNQSITRQQQAQARATATGTTVTAAYDGADAIKHIHLAHADKKIPTVAKIIADSTFAFTGSDLRSEDHFSRRTKDLQVIKNTLYSKIKQYTTIQCGEKYRAACFDPSKRQYYN